VTAAQAIERASAVRRFRPYAEYKDSGLEWLGEIPAHWEVKRLKNLATVQLSNVDKKSVEGQQEVRLCNYTDVYYHEHITGDMEFMAATATPEQVRRFSLRAGDVLITKDSESWTDIAVPAVVAHDLPGVLCGYHLAHIRPDDDCDGGFLSRAFAAIGLRHQFQIAANGITRFGLGGDAISTGTFAVPPLGEQRTIAAFLDRETARINALVVKKERLIQLLQEKRTAVVNRAVTNGLDPNVPMRDSGVGWLGTIPAHWDVKPNRFLFDERNERGRDDLPILEVSIGSGVRVREFSDSKVEQRSDDLRTYKVAKAGDVSFNKMRMWQGAVGMTPVEGLVSPDYIVAQPRASTDPRYYTSLFRTPTYMAEVYRWSHGIVDDRNRLYWDDFKAIPSPVPPIKEQHAIALFLSSETREIDDLMAKIRNAIDRLSELRLALISAAVTGKIDVRSEIA
jgi:type I restriction enzyme S subunit